MPNPENSPYMTAEEWDSMEKISRDELPKNEELGGQAPGSQYLDEEYIKEHETNLNRKTNKERTFTDMDLYARNSYEDVNEQGEDRIRRNDLTLWTEVIPYEEKPYNTSRENAMEYNNLIVRRQKNYPRMERETPAEYRKRIEIIEEDIVAWKEVIPYEENPYKTLRENAIDYENIIVTKQKERPRIEGETPAEYRERIEEAYNLDLKRDIRNLEHEYRQIKLGYESAKKDHDDLISPEEKFAAKRKMDYLKNEYNKTGFDLYKMLDKYEQVKKMEQAKREELYGKEESVPVQENDGEVEKNQEANEEENKKITYREIISGLSQIVGNKIANEVDKFVKKLLKNRGNKVLKATNFEQPNRSA